MPVPARRFGPGDGADQVVARGVAIARPVHVNPAATALGVVGARYRPPRWRSELTLGLCGGARCAARGLDGVEPVGRRQPRCFRPVAGPVAVAGADGYVVYRCVGGVAVGCGSDVAGHVVPVRTAGRLGPHVVTRRIAHRVPSYVQVAAAGGNGLRLAGAAGTGIAGTATTYQGAALGAAGPLPPPFTARTW